MSVSALPVVLQCDRLAIGFAERTLVEPFDRSVREGERWAVLGANGSGKPACCMLCWARPLPISRSWGRRSR